MVTVLGLAVIGAVTGFLLARRSAKPGFDTIMFVFFGLVFGAIGGVIVAFIVDVTTIVAVQKEWVVTSQVNLAAMRTEDTLEGAFFLASGSIDEEHYYRYYAETSDGGYVFRRLEAEREDVIVYEDREEGGVLIIKELLPVEKYGWLKWFFLAPYPGALDRRYEFHIPKGSLIQEFRLE